MCNHTSIIKTLSSEEEVELDGTFMTDILSGEKVLQKHSKPEQEVYVVHIFVMENTSQN